MNCEPAARRKCMRFFFRSVFDEKYGVCIFWCVRIIAKYRTVSLECLGCVRTFGRLFLGPTRGYAYGNFVALHIKWVRQIAAIIDT